MSGEASPSSHGLIGESPVFREVLATVARFAACDVPVLIYGETGTGKEMIARALHYQGPRRNRPFVPVNCGALPDALVENELFGHSRGAYTDARVQQKGLVALAEGGTLLLDEVDSLSHRAQVALLRFLQDRQYRPLGAEYPVKADVRIVAATNADLGSLIGKGVFRQDLLFRLDVAPVRLPPLRERGDDVVLLAEYFLGLFAKQYRRSQPVLEHDIRQALTAYGWPGNVRELENTMHRVAILSERGHIESLPLGILSHSAPVASRVAPSPPDMDYGGGLRSARARHQARFEDGYLRWLLGQTGGNISAAARTAGTERRHLGRMIRRAGLSAEAFRLAMPSRPPGP